MTTYKEMCEKIVEADILQKKDGTPLTAVDVWNYSSTGELFMISDWYHQALAKLGEPDPELEALMVDELPENPALCDFRIHDGHGKIWNGIEWQDV